MKKIMILLIVSIFFVVGCKSKDSVKSVAQKNNLQPIELDEYMKILDKELGKDVLVVFFASWCPVCHSEIDDLKEYYKTMDSSSASVVMISVDQSKPELEEFLKNNELPFPVYYADRKLSTRLGITSIPTNVIYNSKGELLHSSPGKIGIDQIQTILGG